jgi:hypothetical protein
MFVKPMRLDPRYFQVIFQALFLCYGLTVLSWPPEWTHYTISIGGCLFFHYALEAIRRGDLPKFSAFDQWGFSVLISAMSLCLLLKTNHWHVSLLAAFLTTVPKYIFRWNDKHIFNPSAFGIVATLLLTNEAWLSPGQWGSNAFIFFAAVTLGVIVVTRVQKLDVSLAFLLSFAGLMYWRQVLVLGWPLDHFIHAVGTGSLLLFTFFMISDPKTSPNHSIARILWAMLIAILAFYLAAFQWKYNTVIWALIMLSPLVPVLDWIFPSKSFTWKNANMTLRLNPFKYFKTFFMKPFTRKLTALIILSGMISQEALAFCGFYVSKADGTLKNKTSQVILVRDGNRTVITMYNDFKGDVKNFAMVVPVPVVLEKKNIKVVDQQIFNTLNEYSKPRLVEYYDQGPCNNWEANKKIRGATAMDEVVVTGYGTRRGGDREERVKIEAKYLVGEYDILILSAAESSGLQSWLDENGYKIPPGAKEVLEPYIKSNMKFFVVKVNEKELKKLNTNFLRPIQIAFKSPKFMLPIRLGMANADGDQDMIVYAFTKRGRIETTNYRTVELPTSKNLPRFIKDNFGGFYSNVFHRQWDRQGRDAVMLEYAWDVSPRNFVKCDPCVATAPSVQDLVQSGVWWIDAYKTYFEDEEDADELNAVHFTRLHIRYGRDKFAQDLQFQVTPNRDNYQVRYIITHPATTDLDCAAGKKYLRDLRQRRMDELDMLQHLTGKGYEDWDVVNNDDEKLIPPEVRYPAINAIEDFGAGRGSGLLFAGIGLAGVFIMVRWGRKKS